MKIINFTPQRILILQTAFLGDVILTLPLLRMAKSLFPEAAVDFLAIPAAKNILENIPLINKLIIYDKHQNDKGMLNFFKQIKKLRQNRYDLALVPHRSIRSAVLVWGAKIPHRIGFDRSTGRLLFNTSYTPTPRGTHEINRNLYLLEPFGIDVTQKVFPEMYFSDEDEKAVFRWMKEKNLNPSGKIITIAPRLRMGYQKMAAGIFCTNRSNAHQ